MQKTTGRRWPARECHFIGSDDGLRTSEVVTSYCARNIFAAATMFCSAGMTSAH